MNVEGNAILNLLIKSSSSTSSSSSSKIISTEDANRFYSEIPELSVISGEDPEETREMLISQSQDVCSKFQRANDCGGDENARKKAAGKVLKELIDGVRNSWASQIAGFLKYFLPEYLRKIVTRMEELGEISKNLDEGQVDIDKLQTCLLALRNDLVEAVKQMSGKDTSSSSSSSNLRRLAFLAALPVAVAIALIVAVTVIIVTGIVCFTNPDKCFLNFKAGPLETSIGTK